MTMTETTWQPTTSATTSATTLITTTTTTTTAEMPAKQGTANAMSLPEVQQLRAEIWSVHVQGGCPIPPRPEKARFFGAHAQSSRFTPLQGKAPDRRFTQFRTYAAPERLRWSFGPLSSARCGLVAVLGAAVRTLVLGAAVLLGTALAAAGCGGGQHVDRDGSVSGDASAVSDASGLSDGTTGPDEDGDGYPAAQDCDDQDPEVYPGSEPQPCQSDCDVGERGCRADGTWSDCTARTDCECSTPGDTRLIDCGNCGQASQSCQSNGMWSFPGDCHGEGECAPGQQESKSCEFCGGTGSRLCDTQCQWLPWEGCSGVCTPGDIITGPGTCTEPYEIQRRECDASCQWQVTAPCTADCLVQARTGTPDYKDEVCVSGSDFLMGSEPGQTYADEEPRHTVTLTPYLIDVYEVTNDRYRECVDAVVCTEPAPWAYYFEPSRHLCPVEGVTFAQAQTFCQWDGGRALPSEAQWEKAARGPFPRTVPDPWGTDQATCDHVLREGCQADDGPYPVDLCSDGISYYGVYNLASNVHEWVADWYDPLYYAVSPTLDPTGPHSGQERVFRGLGYNHTLLSYHDTVTKRYSLSPDIEAADLGFRCVRPGY